MPTAAAEQALRIKWNGPSGQDAEELASALSVAGSVPLNQDPTARATMAGGEIVLTILASAATQAIIHVALDKLRDYIKEKIAAGRIERKKAPNMRVIVQGKNVHPAEKLISLRLATADFAAEFIKDLGDEVAKAI